MAADFKLNIAGKVIRVLTLSEKTQTYCSRYLAPPDSPEDFTIAVTGAMIQAEREHEAGHTDLTVDLPEEQAAMLEQLALYRAISEQLLTCDTWLMHGSVIAVDGEAYMFTAASGTGKSTHSRLWRKTFGDRAVMVNDDKPLLQLAGDCVLACGTPWNGKHGLGKNIQVPLKGICCLTRAEDNSIERLSVEDAFPLIYQQTYRPDDAAKLMKTLDLIDALLKRVPVYQLQMNNYKEDAVAVCYNGMCGAEQPEHAG